MAVNIIFLGTGPSGRIPRPGCEWPSCIDARKPGSKSRRLQQSLMMRSGDTSLLFDISEDIIPQWRHAGDIGRLDAAFISHPHNDAYGGLERVKTVLGKLKQKHLPVYAESETWARAKEQFKELAHLEQRAMRLNEPAHIGPFTVSPFRVWHTLDPATHPTVGFSIRAGGRHIVLISDVKKIPASSFPSIGRPDLLILDCAVFEKDFPTHVNLEQALAMIKKIRAKKTYLTQIGVTWPPYKEARHIARRAGVDITCDGLKIRI